MPTLKSAGLHNRALTKHPVEPPSAKLIDKINYDGYIILHITITLYLLFRITKSFLIFLLTVAIYIIINSMMKLLDIREITNTRE